MPRSSLSGSCSPIWCVRKTLLNNFWIFLIQAEEINIKGRVYHKHCLTCKNCKRCIDINILAIGLDDDIYCRVCCLKISWYNLFFS